MLVDLSKKKSYNAKVIEIESKITSISGLATSAALILVENKISNVSGLAKKAYYDAKISDIESNILLRLIMINLLVKHLMQR